MSQRADLAQVSIGLAAAAWFFSSALRRRRRIELTGRVAIVTGGARGLGLAITRELVARGCRVAICGRDERVVRATVDELRRAGSEVFGAACDVSDPEQVSAFVESVLARYGSIDVLVNNAGQCFVGPAVELQRADLDYALRNIFWLHYHPTMAVLPHMRERRFGRIANVTSFGGKVPIPHQAAYVAGKYAGTGWSHTLSTELSRDGIGVSTITPPPLRNGAPLHVHVNGDALHEFRWFTRALTSRLTGASPERTARAVVDAVQHGDADRSVTARSWLLSRLHGAAPNVSLRLLAAFERLLPRAAPPGVTSHMRLATEVVAASDDPHVHRLAEAAGRDEQKYVPEPA